MGSALIRVSQVWEAKIPFGEGGSGAKSRPVIILGWAGLIGRNGDRHILVVPSSTFDGDPSKARASDLQLRDWRSANLGENSFIQCARLWSLAPEAFNYTKGCTGTVDANDMTKILAEVAKMFAVSASDWATI